MDQTAPPVFSGIVVDPRGRRNRDEQRAQHRRARIKRDVLARLLPPEAMLRIERPELLGIRHQQHQQHQHEASLNAGSSPPPALTIVDPAEDPAAVHVFVPRHTFADDGGRLRERRGGGDKGAAAAPDAGARTTFTGRKRQSSPPHHNPASGIFAVHAQEHSVWDPATLAGSSAFAPLATSPSSSKSGVPALATSFSVRQRWADATALWELLLGSDVAAREVAVAAAIRKHAAPVVTGGEGGAPRPLQPPTGGGKAIDLRQLANRPRQSVNVNDTAVAPPLQTRLLALRRLFHAMAAAHRVHEGGRKKALVARLAQKQQQQQLQLDAGDGDGDADRLWFPMAHLFALPPLERRAPAGGGAFGAGSILSPSRRRAGSRRDGSESVNLTVEDTPPMGRSGRKAAPREARASNVTIGDGAAPMAKFPAVVGAGGRCDSPVIQFAPLGGPPRISIGIATSSPPPPPPPAARRVPRTNVFDAEVMGSDDRDGDGDGEASLLLLGDGSTRSDASLLSPPHNQQRMGPVNSPTQGISPPGVLTGRNTTASDGDPAHRSAPTPTQLRQASIGLPQFGGDSDPLLLLSPKAAVALAPAPAPDAAAHTSLFPPTLKRLLRYEMMKIAMLHGTHTDGVVVDEALGRRISAPLVSHLQLRVGPDEAEADDSAAGGGGGGGAGGKRKPARRGSGAEGEDPVAAELTAILGGDFRSAGGNFAFTSAATTASSGTGVSNGVPPAMIAKHGHLVPSVAERIARAERDQGGAPLSNRQLFDIHERYAADLRYAAKMANVEPFRASTKGQLPKHRGDGPAAAATAPMPVPVPPPAALGRGVTLQPLDAPKAGARPPPPGLFLPPPAQPAPPADVASLRPWSVARLYHTVTTVLEEHNVVAAVLDLYRQLTKSTGSAAEAFAAGAGAQQSQPQPITPVAYAALSKSFFISVFVHLTEAEVFDLVMLDLPLDFSGGGLDRTREAVMRSLTNVQPPPQTQQRERERDLSSSAPDPALQSPPSPHYSSVATSTSTGGTAPGNTLLPLLRGIYAGKAAIHAKVAGPGTADSSSSSRPADAATDDAACFEEMLTRLERAEQHALSATDFLRWIQTLLLGWLERGTADEAVRLVGRLRDLWLPIVDVLDVQFLPMQLHAKRIKLRAIVAHVASVQQQQQQQPQQQPASAAPVPPPAPLPLPRSYGPGWFSLQVPVLSDEDLASDEALLSAAEAQTFTSVIWRFRMMGVAGTAAQHAAGPGLRLSDQYRSLLPEHHRLCLQLGRWSLPQSAASHYNNSANDPAPPQAIAGGAHAAMAIDATLESAGDRLRWLHEEAAVATLVAGAVGSRAAAKAPGATSKAGRGPQGPNPLLLASASFLNGGPVSAIAAGGGGGGASVTSQPTLLLLSLNSCHGPATFLRDGGAPATAPAAPAVARGPIGTESRHRAIDDDHFADEWEAVHGHSGADARADLDATVGGSADAAPREVSAALGLLLGSSRNIPPPHLPGACVSAPPRALVVDAPTGPPALVRTLRHEQAADLRQRMEREFVAHDKIASFAFPLRPRMQK